MKGWVAFSRAAGSLIRPEKDGKLLQKMNNIDYKYNTATTTLGTTGMHNFAIWYSLWLRGFWDRFN